MPNGTLKAKYVCTLAASNVWIACGENTLSAVGRTAIVDAGDIAGAGAREDLTRTLPLGALQL